MRVFTLPEDLRSQLKEPLGRLYRGNGIQCIVDMGDDLLGSAKVLAVGDITAFYLLEHSIAPDLIIVDHKTKREPAPDHVKKGIAQPNYRTIEVENPPGTLTQELIDLIMESLNGSERVKIVVDGEEDLAALPVILHAPIGSAVLYGQPGEGCVLVQVTPERVEFVKDLMSRMLLEE